MVNGIAENLTAAKIEEYWRKTEDLGYTETGSWDMSQNCYGHAFGAGTFVNGGPNGSEILRMDGYWAMGVPEPDVDHLYIEYGPLQNSDHVIKSGYKYCDINLGSGTIFLPPIRTSVWPTRRARVVPCATILSGAQ